MKIKTMVLLAIWIVVVTACQLLTPPPYIHQEMAIEKDAEGKIIKSKYTRTVKGLANADPNTVISEWAYADQTVRIPTEGAKKEFCQQYVFLKIKNITKNYSVIIRSAPFTGLTLNPGEISKKSEKIAVGVYPLVFAWYELGRSTHGEKTINVQIYEGRQEPITIMP